MIMEVTRSDLYNNGILIARTCCGSLGIDFSVYSYISVHFTEPTYWIIIGAAVPQRLNHHGAGVFCNVAEKTNGGPVIA